MLKLGLFQHPPMIRRTFRVPDESLPSRVWRRLRGVDQDGHRVEVELRQGSTVWLRVTGSLTASGADRLAAGIIASLRKRKERLVLDLDRLGHTESEALDRLAQRLRDFTNRIRLVGPESLRAGTTMAMFAMEA
jgi:hypothetical protein